MGTRRVLSAQIALGEFGVTRFAERCGAHVVGPDAMRDIDPKLDSLRNVNDRATYEAVLRELDA